MTTETFAFQAEINQLMSLIINTFYSNKDIFLRELISNSSDAIDKIRYQSLTDKSVLDAESELFIKLIPDKETKTLTIYDSGIGMTKNDLINNLGTIAKSGTRSFMEAIQSSTDAPSMIGQFGVGFYSAFLVADSVKVITKHNDDQQYTWESQAGGSFTISTSNDESINRGTKIILYIKDDLTEYLDEARIKNLVRKYSEFISYPITLYSLIENEEPSVEEQLEQTEQKSEQVEQAEPKYEWRLLNKNKPLWTRNPKDLTHEDYASFYKSFYNDWEDHLAHKHFSVEGNVEFTGLIYVPRREPFEVLREARKNLNFKLYVKKIFIMDDCEDIVPEWLRFVKGLVDSEDLPLNISREILQQNRVLKMIKKNMTKKSIELFEEIATDKEKYKTFYDAFSKHLKLGVHEDIDNQERIATLLRYDSTVGDNRSLDDYISNMKEGQKDIYYVSGESRSAVENSPFLEVLKKKDLEVLYLVDPIDEYMVNQFRKYKEKTIVSISKEELDLPETEEEKRQREETTKSYSELCKVMKDILSSSVEKVQIGKRISESPCVLVTPNYGISANMERISKAQTLGCTFRPYSSCKKILEINPNNPIIQSLKSRSEINPEDKTVKDLTWLLFEMTLLTSGFSLDNNASFATRISRMIHLGLQIEEPVNNEINNEIKDENIEELCETTLNEID